MQEINMQEKKIFLTLNLPCINSLIFLVLVMPRTCVRRIWMKSMILTSTEKEIVIKARLVQGAFREKLIRYWRGCAISRCPQVDLLIASHIKPWSLSTDEEKVDVFNGLLLLPHYDKLFDSGYMTFTPEGKVVYSELLSDDVRRILNLTNDLSLCHLEEGHKQYLQYHNEYCFKKNRGR